MAALGMPDIRGEERQQLIQDLAEGTLTHSELAARYGGRHVQAIAQFAVRNKAEIAVVQHGISKALHERLSEVGIADQARRVAVDNMLRDDLLQILADPDLDPKLRNAYTKTVRLMHRGVAEELGDLKQRLDLSVQKNVLQDFTEFVIDEDGTFHPLAGSNVDGNTAGDAAASQ